MQLSMWQEIGSIWRKDAKSCWTSLRRMHVATEIAWQQMSHQRDGCMSRNRVLSVGIWLYLAAAIQQTLLSICFRVKRREEHWVLPRYRANEQKYIPNPLHWELGSGISRDVRLAERAADAFSMPERRQECCLGKWWVMAKAVKEIRMCEGKTEQREVYKSQGPQTTLWAIRRVAQPAWLSPLLNRRHLAPDVFTPEVHSKLGRNKADQWRHPTSGSYQGRAKEGSCLHVPFLPPQVSYTSQNDA